MAVENLERIVVSRMLKDGFSIGGEPSPNSKPDIAPFVNAEPQGQFRIDKSAVHQSPTFRKFEALRDEILPIFFLGHAVSGRPISAGINGLVSGKTHKEKHRKL